MLCSLSAEEAFRFKLFFMSNMFYIHWCTYKYNFVFSIPASIYWYALSSLSLPSSTSSLLFLPAVRRGGPRSSSIIVKSVFFYLFIYALPSIITCRSFHLHLSLSTMGFSCPLPFVYDVEPWCRCDGTRWDEPREEVSERKVKNMLRYLTDARQKDGQTLH